MSWVKESSGIPLPSEDEGENRRREEFKANEICGYLAQDSELLAMRLDLHFKMRGLHPLPPNLFSLPKQDRQQVSPKEEYRLRVEHLREICREACRRLESAVIDQRELPSGWDVELRWWPENPIRNPTDLADYLEKVLARDSEPYFNRPSSDEYADVSPFEEMTIRSVGNAIASWGMSAFPATPKKIIRHRDAREEIRRIVFWLREQEIANQFAPSPHVPDENRTLESKVLAITSSESSLLNALAASPNQCWKLVDLSSRLEINRKTLGDIVKRLLESGLICRPRGPRSGIMLSKVGEAFLKRKS